jgi:hypothetical protein
MTIVLISIMYNMITTIDGEKGLSEPMNPGLLFPLEQTPCLVLLHLEDWETFIIILLLFTLFH